MKILLDTNFLIAAVKYRIDLFSELEGHELFLSVPVLKELAMLSKGAGKTALAARLSLKLAKSKGLKTLNAKGTADAALLSLSLSGYTVGTQDRELREKIRKAGGKTALIRQKKYIEVE